MRNAPLFNKSAPEVDGTQLLGLNTTPPEERSYGDNSLAVELGMRGILPAIAGCLKMQLSAEALK